MRQGIVLIGMGIAVWGAAALFLLLFGKYVLLEVNDPYFGSSVFLLIMLTLLLLIGLSVVVKLRMFREKGSAARFGHIAAFVGLVLNAFVFWHRESVFPNFSDGQHQAYAICTTFAYALALLVPSVVDRLIKDHVDDGRVSAAAGAPARPAESGKVGANEQEPERERQEQELSKS